MNFTPTLGHNPLSQRILAVGAARCRFLVPMRPVRQVPLMGLGYTSSSDPEVIVPAQVSENRYALKDGYKITLTSMVPVFGNEHFSLIRQERIDFFITAQVAKEPSPAKALASILHHHGVANCRILYRARPAHSFLGFEYTRKNDPTHLTVAKLSGSILASRNALDMLSKRCALESIHRGISTTKLSFAQLADAVLSGDMELLHPAKGWV